jgi:phage-related protein
MIDDIIIVAGTGIEPITQQEAKDYLEINGTDDDDLVDALILAAREHIESHCQVSLKARTGNKVIGSGTIEVQLPYYPVDSSSIVVTDENGWSVTFDRLGDTKPFVTVNGIGSSRYTITYNSTASTDNVFKTACRLLVKSMYNHGTMNPQTEDDYYWTAIKLIDPKRLL